MNVAKLCKFIDFFFISVNFFPLNLSLLLLLFENTF
jgi:hypothetical protein